MSQQFSSIYRYSIFRMLKAEDANHTLSNRWYYRLNAQDYRFKGDPNG